MQADQLFDQAFREHQAGNLARAKTLYREVVQVRPSHADALNLIGTIARQENRPAEAVEWIRRAIAAGRPTGDYYFNLAEACRAAGELDQALDNYRAAVRLQPKDPEIQHALGITLTALGQHAPAADAYRKATELQPRMLPAYDALAESLRLQKQFEAAAGVCAKALAIDPRRAECHYVLGLVAADQGRAEAESSLRRAAELKPDWPEPHLSLAVALEARGRLPEATAACETALRCAPRLDVGWNLLGTLLDKQARLTEAVRAYRRALELNPKSALAASNFGNTVQDLGLPPEALALHRRAVELTPDAPEPHHNLLMCLNYQPQSDPVAVFAEHRRWGDQWAQRVPPSPNQRVPGRHDRIRIAYHSPDFKSHSVAWFIEPILRHHDATRFDVTCYSDVARPDAVTERLAKLVPHWRPVATLDDAALARLIEKDEIDVLVDLVGHTAGNRMGVFARRPAPVQVTYLGYPNTTGLPRDRMHYRLTDALADPPGSTDAWHTEELIRLPESFLCYSPPADAPEPSPPPGISTGRITFGSFNQFAKVNPAVVALWSRILAAVPGSRLLLKAKTLVDEQARKAIARRFADCGIDPQRVTLSPSERTTARHLARYAEVDVALDPFPYNGTTTTCEALWMGVPVVTLAGATHHARVGVSLLANAGLSSLVARTQDDYVDLAVSLAQDAGRLRDLRATLRTNVRQSPLTDAPRFTRHLEDAYRRIVDHHVRTRVP